jgi:hypothetical protein
MGKRSVYDFSIETSVSPEPLGAIGQLVMRFTGGGAETYASGS